jgi:LmbE family N-acetylglucosaminyl deacetylase
MAEAARHVLVVSPHPDDESIGCGGSLHRHAAAGDVVRVVFLTSGEQGGHGPSPEAVAELREQEARAAAAVLGVTHVEFWREPDGALRASPRLVGRLRECMRDLRPRVVYVPHEGEMHLDHQAAARLVCQAVTDLVRDDPDVEPPEVWMFEVWTPVQRIDQIIDISLSIDAKVAAVRAHASQCRVMRFDEACRGLARYRGEMHLWPGGDYAEAVTEWHPPRAAAAPEGAAPEAEAGAEAEAEAQAQAAAGHGGPS